MMHARRHHSNLVARPAFERELVTSCKHEKERGDRIEQNVSHRHSVGGYVLLVLATATSDTPEQVGAVYVESAMFALADAL